MGARRLTSVVLPLKLPAQPMWHIFRQEAAPGSLHQPRVAQLPAFRTLPGVPLRRSPCQRSLVEPALTLRCPRIISARASMASGLACTRVHPKVRGAQVKQPIASFQTANSRRNIELSDR